MAVYEPTIGLEIHAELKSATKMFCCSKNDAEEARPNVNVCPVCMAHPGTLPVINREAVRSVLRVGSALGSTLADYTEFDRKNYFYPDLPKGYQLSQYEYPLVEGGALAGVRLTRIHLEEDTASSMHDDATGTTVIDYNRAGVPLMELVTEPVIKSAEEAGRFARELQLLLRYLGVSEANMEKGQMRVEANVSVGTEGKLGTKVEIKNLNSFNAMERAVRYEIERQTALLEKGDAVAQQTLGWDERRQATFPQRSKEGSADYRYFPDPDLPSLKLSELEGFDVESLRSELPELPSQRRERYLKAGLQAEDAELYVRDVRFGDFFDAVSESLAPEAVRIASNYLANDVVKLVRDIETRDSILLDKMPISSDAYSTLVGMVAAKKVSSKAAKELLIAAVNGEDPEAYASAHGLLQQDDPALVEKAVSQVLATHESVAADYRAGKAPALEFLLGRAMKELRGAADPMEVREALKKKLG
jgi:aspartyl-tRNA(Asn)/glutamyl-tRNA(Gln) amidotransferase subunit B